MSDEDRHSEALGQEIITDPEQRARQEIRNGARQFDFAVELIESSLQPEKPFRLKPSTILSLNRLALEGIEGLAGVYRPVDIAITESRHKPPAPYLVPELVEELCEYVNTHWDRSPIHLASYVMWRLNWIHPFVDGNGRTTRITSFVVLCVRLGYRVPGTKTIPEQIARNKKPYYEALEQADLAYDKDKRVDVSAMESLLGTLLANQLAGVIHDAKSEQHPSVPYGSEP
jgi:Fic family protein